MGNPFAERQQSIRARRSYGPLSVSFSAIKPKIAAKRAFFSMPRMVKHRIHCHRTSAAIDFKPLNHSKLTASARNHLWIFAAAHMYRYSQSCARVFRYAERTAHVHFVILNGPAISYPIVYPPLKEILGSEKSLDRYPERESRSCAPAFTDRKPLKKSWLSFVYSGVHPCHAFRFSSSFFRR